MLLRNDYSEWQSQAFGSDTQMQANIHAEAIGVGIRLYGTVQAVPVEWPDTWLTDLEIDYVIPIGE